MGHKSKFRRHGEAVPQINTPILKELEKKAQRLRQIGDVCPTHEFHTVMRAVAKIERRIERMKVPEKKEAKKSEEKKLTQEEKIQKKKDYERQRKNRYKEK